MTSCFCLPGLLVAIVNYFLSICFFLHLFWAFWLYYLHRLSEHSDCLGH